MDKRKSIKALAIGTISTGVLVEACKIKKKEKPAQEAKATEGINRMPEEKANDDALQSARKFFTDAEMATIIVHEKTEHQIPLKGGLRWLDLECINRYGKAFTDCPQQQQIEMVDMIAYPKKAKPEMAPGVKFFSLMRNLTATGFYTSEIGVKDVGYMGNVPNNWNGVPDDVLKQYGLAYTEKELKECVSF